MDPWEKIEAAAVTGNIPVRGIIELTYRCNFGCVLCYLNTKRQQEDMLSRDQCRRLFDDLRQAGALALTFTGGEPFLHPDLAGILGDARAAHLAVRIFTNGSLIGPDEAAMLAEVKPLSVDVSLYGSSPDTYAQVTGNASHFEAVLSGLEGLRQAEVNTVIKIVVNRLNCREVEAMRALAVGFGAAAVMTPLITPTDCGDTAPCALMLEGRALEDYFREYGPEQPPLERKGGDAVCTCGRSGFVISPSGEVFPCIQVRNSVGNALTVPFGELWSRNPGALLQEVRGLTFADLEQCTACADRNYCFVCPGLNLLSSGSLTGTHPATCTFAALRRCLAGEG